MTSRVWPNSNVRSSRLYGATVLIFAALPFSSQLALAQFTQQGPKLVGTFAVGAAFHGFSVALSADGNTAMVGGPDDNANTGAAWVYTRSDGVWILQGSKLVGTDASGYAQQGFSVALSADGKTAIVGGNGDNSTAGAVWIYTRSGNGWVQQGNKLVGSGASGNANQGLSVALSADGNTAIVGGNLDNSAIGAAWVFTRSKGVWTQQGDKLVGGDFGGNWLSGLLGRAVCRRQHRDRGGLYRQLVHRGGMGLHPKQRCLDAAGQQAGRHRRGRNRRPRHLPSRCQPTATPPSCAGVATTRALGRRGFSPAAAICGRSRATSWSAPVRSGLPPAHPWRCPLTATPPSRAGISTARTWGRRGSTRAAQATALGSAGRQAGWCRRGGSRPPVFLRGAVRQRQHRHRGRAGGQLGSRCGMGLRSADHEQRRMQRWGMEKFRLVAGAVHNQGQCASYFAK